LKDHLSSDEHQRTLAWLDDSLGWAHSRSRMKLVRLLNLVRTEILVDVDPSKSPPSTRAPADGSAFGADRGV
jgi:hypothetical protein